MCSVIRVEFDRLLLHNCNRARAEGVNLLLYGPCNGRIVKELCVRSLYKRHILRSTVENGQAKVDAGSMQCKLSRLRSTIKHCNKGMKSIKAN